MSETDPDGMPVTVASYALPLDAHWARVRLEAEGIDCWLADEHTVTMNWALALALGGIKVQVRPKDLDRAVAVLQADPDARAATGQV